MNKKCFKNLTFNYTNRQDIFKLESQRYPYNRRTSHSPRKTTQRCHSMLGTCDITLGTRRAQFVPGPWLLADIPMEESGYRYKITRNYLREKEVNMVTIQAHIREKVHMCKFGVRDRRDEKEEKKLHFISALATCCNTPCIILNPQFKTFFPIEANHLEKKHSAEECELLIIEHH